MRIVLTLFACLGLIAFALVELPPNSQAVQTPRSRPSAQASIENKGKRARFRAGEVLVRYRSESIARSRTGRNVVAAANGDFLAADVERFEGAELVAGLRLARVAPDQTLEAVAALRRQSEVLYAEPNYLLRATAVPNDTHFLAGRQYGLAKIGVQSVWDNFTTGSANVVVAVIDQGIDLSHPDLEANIWTNPSPGSIPGITGDLNGYNFNDDNSTIFSHDDLENHATHVAGIVGATGNNGLGVTGVNWSVRLMSLKFLDELSGDGDTADAIRACTYVKQMRDLWLTQGPAKGANVRVINASFGGNEFVQAFQDVINELNASGILFVAAAGNKDNGMLEPDNNLIPTFPSDYEAPNIISVAATNEADSLSSFSHFGRTKVDLGAPGEGILSTTPPCTDPGPFPDFPCEPAFPIPFGDTTPTYSIFDGTSMAAPHVSGAAALMWAHNPNLTVAQVKNLLLLNGDVQAALVDKTLTGRRLNIGKSFVALQQTDTTAPGAVTNFRVNFQNGRTISLSWNAGGDDGAGGNAAALYDLSFVETGTGTVIPLKGVVPANPGSAQTTLVTIPYRRLAGNLRLRPFDEKGNEGAAVNVPVTVSQLDGNPYITSVGPAVPLTTGGARQNLAGDDRYLNFPFPAGFTFPFFGTTFNSVTISTNGNLFFQPPPRRINLLPTDLDDADDSPGAPKAIGGYKAISGLWEDLDLRISSRTDAGVYVTQLSNPTRLIFRWQGIPCNFNTDTHLCQGGAPVNFEVELRPDGTIKTRYGTGNTNIIPAVGIGGGDQEGYLITTHSSEEAKISLQNAGEVTFTPRAQWSSTVLTGPQVDMKSWTQGGRTFVYAKLTFPDAGFRVTNWGNATRAGSAFTADATVERFNGQSPLAISNTAQIWDLGVIDPGNYTFTFKNSGTTVKTLNFTVSSTAPPPNIIDGAREFVRWQYKDFLRREPDLPGWAHWEGEITQCTNPAFRLPGETEEKCVDRKRDNTSAAFFLSPEFSNVGYFVLRVYRGSLGRMPHFGGSGTPADEFTRDAEAVGLNIVQNDALVPSQMNTNKQAFVNQFVTRPEFRAIYDLLTNTQYVDKLFQTTGIAPSSTDRANLINGLNAGSETRASVLFKVVDGTTTIEGGHLVFNTPYGKAFYDAQFNAAFVQMEYFGYLQRDPDPDGYAFWLGKLNLFGDWKNAEMVRAFIVSPEYRSRFGQP
jgi:subtilisin family serine protease